MAEPSERGTYRHELSARGPITPYQMVQVRQEGAVATIALNDPDTLNCYRMRMTGELRDALDAANENPTVKAVILTGAGSAFYAGGDIRRMRETPMLPAELYEYSRHEFSGVLYRIIGMDKPVIAAVNGHALGVGFFAVLACDLVVASEWTRFGTAYILRPCLGMPAHTSCVPLVRSSTPAAPWNLV